MKNQFWTVAFLLCVAACGRINYDPLRDASVADTTDLSPPVDQGTDAFDSDVPDGGDAMLTPDLGIDMDVPAVPDVVVAPVSGLITTEGGASAIFTVVLAAEPTTNVFVTLASSDASEGTIAPAVLAFTVINWNAPQSVTVTGVDDAAPDGDTAYTVLVQPAVSADARYQGIDGADVSLTNIDDDSAGVFVSETTGLLTTEAGGTDTFFIRLNSAPSADVTIAVSSNRAGEATATPATLTFTPENYASPHVVTVTGVNDAIRDGDQSFTIVTGNTASADVTYAAIDVPDVAGTNLDDETAALRVTASPSLETTEAGGTATFSLVLQSQPTADVFVPLLSSDTSEGSVPSTSLMFTALNWNSPQVVTVTGVNDSVRDGDQLYSISIGPSTSADPDYADLTAPSVSLRNLDDETARVVTTPAGGLHTSEAGATATFALSLGSLPSADVTILVTSSNTLEGTVAPPTYLFTAANWSTPQVVTITGVDDSFADGDQTYDAIVHISASADSDYSSLADRRISITNTDNDTASISVTPTSGLTTNESGATATFTVVLNSEPAASVSVALSSDTPSEGTVSPASVMFTTGNWNIPQTVTVTGVDDVFADGSRAYSIVTAAAVSADSAYSGVNPSDVSVVNADNDSAGFSLSRNSGLTTTEAGGSDTFTVVLLSQPTASVSVSFSSLTPSEGTVTSSTLVFTGANWNIPQTVTVTGVDDDYDDGSQSYTVNSSFAVSADPFYSGSFAGVVSVTNTDNDTAGFFTTPTSINAPEGGAAGTYTVVLMARPMADVVLPLYLTDTAQGMISPSSLTFTSANWSTPQTVTVTAVDDVITDGTVTNYARTFASMSTDSPFAGINGAEVVVTHADNDVASIVVTPTSGLVTTEAGGTATFTIVLGARPLSNVNFAVTSNDATEGTASPGFISFMPANWNVPQTVTVTGVNDFSADGSIAYSIITDDAISGDVAFSGLVVADVSVTNTDNDVVGVTVTPTTGLVTTELGGTATFTVQLTSAPISGVLINLTSSNTGEGTVAPAMLAFSTLDWNMPQTATVTGVNDNVIDGNIPFTIVTSATSSVGDPTYDALTVADVTVNNHTSLHQEAYVKASNTGNGDQFGLQFAISGDGTTLAVGAYAEASNAMGIGGVQSDNSLSNAGAVYVFTRSGSTWTQQAYIKASNPTAQDFFGNSVGLSSDGSTLVVGAHGESSNATGIGGNQADNSLAGAGAAYVFTRSGTVWSQQAYVKASNTAQADFFGWRVAVAADGNTMAVCAYGEDSAATGVGGAQGSNGALESGAVYVFTRAVTVWSQQAYIKASNTENSDNFGWDVSLSADGNTLGVTAALEDSAATGIGGNQADNTASASGAAYVFVRVGVVWSQQAYIKASNTRLGTKFGETIAVSGDGDTLAVGSTLEASNATGVGGDQANTLAGSSGAVYVFTRTGVVWTQQAYVKASNTGNSDNFGSGVGLSSNGSTLLVGAWLEDSNATGVEGNQSDNSAGSSGAAYVFTRAGVTWTQVAYIKPLNTEASDSFGYRAARMSSDGLTLVVGSSTEDSNATGVNGDGSNNSLSNSGAVYVFTN